MSTVIPKGYKQTKVGVIPEDWDIVNLGDVGKVVTGLTYSPENIDKDGVLVLRSSNIQERKLSFNDNVYVNISTLKFNPVKENDILICVRNGSKSLIGKNALIDKQNEGVAFGAFMSVYRSKYNSFMFQLFDTKVYKREVHRNLGATINSINGSDLKKFRIPFPPQKEQQKIAQILASWDKSITIQEMLIKAKVQLKKGLMQKLLSGKVRFHGFSNEWEEVGLNKVLFHNSRPVDKPKEGYWKLGLRSHAKGTFHTFVEDPETVRMDTLYFVKENDLIVNITFAWEHALALASIEDEGKLVSHRFPTYVFKSGYSPLFFKYLMMQPRFKYELENISPGGAGRNRVMSKKDFLKLKVTVPTLKEQQKIAEALTYADKEINLLKNELVALKEQKRGLMQKLLTGEVRVNI